MPEELGRECPECGSVKITLKGEMVDADALVGCLFTFKWTGDCYRFIECGTRRTELYLGQYCGELSLSSVTNNLEYISRDLDEATCTDCNTTYPVSPVPHGDSEPVRPRDLPNIPVDMVYINQNSERRYVITEFTHNRVVIRQEEGERQFTLQLRNFYTRYLPEVAIEGWPS